MAKKYLKAIIILVALGSINFSLAQGNRPPRPPGPGGRPNLPIDGGLAVLFVLGAGYAVKKIHEDSKE
jgi:hypothetical protein